MKIVIKVQLGTIIVVVNLKFSFCLAAVRAWLTAWNKTCQNKRLKLHMLVDMMNNRVIEIK
jgi:hypothetical protein